MKRNALLGSLSELYWNRDTLMALKGIIRACGPAFASSPHSRLSNGPSANLKYRPLAAEQVY
jgi:hypothetical protein